MSSNLQLIKVSDESDSFVQYTTLTCFDKAYDFYGRFCINATIPDLYFNSHVAGYSAGYTTVSKKYCTRFEIRLGVFSGIEARSGLAESNNQHKIGLSMVRRLVVFFICLVS